MRGIRHVILPDSGADLLRRELARGFAAAGLRVSRIRPGDLHHPTHPHRLDELASFGPSLLFSVNFQGLSPLAGTLEALRRAGGQAAVWIVDNPWNVLSGVRDPRWKSLPLFVTDPFFIAPLRAHGAGRVLHLPLAAGQEFYAREREEDGRHSGQFPEEERQSAPVGLAPFVFVGRSSFPGKSGFFAGVTVPPDLTRTAGEMLGAGGRPDLSWWERSLALTEGPFWPGKLGRVPALGAEDANFLWRCLCLQAAARGGGGLKGGSAMEPDQAGLDIFGDAGWARALPRGARLRPPVDYYRRLPAVYAAARYSLSLTSLQLPSGLNQRHFDVWAAGGFCLTDATPGLDLFPAELTAPVTFTRPGDIPAVAARLEGSASRSLLQAQWKSLILERHTYARRVAFLLDALEGW